MPLEPQSTEEHAEQDDAAKPVDISKDNAKEAQKRSVKSWCKRIRAAKTYFKSDYHRMRRNMEFAYGLQWNDQLILDDDRYSANVTLKSINQKVATLYAREPKAVAKRRKRLDFQLWDGSEQSLLQALMSVQTNPFDIASRAVLMDYQQGKQWQTMLDKVGKTLEVVYQYECDAQEISFKTQMKHLVRRVCTCGVGFVEIDLKREFETPEIYSTGVSDSVIETALKAKRIIEKLSKGSIESNDKEVETLRLLIAAVENEAQTTAVKVQEHLYFDFLPPTSIVVDPRCRNLRGFVGAHWLVKELVLPIETINAEFEVDLKLSTSEDGVKQYNERGEAFDSTTTTSTDQGEEDRNKMACLWKVWDRDTKSQFYIVDGHSEYVSEPEKVTPEISDFFPIATLTFNDVETDPTTRARIYPPSDVDLMKSAQKEINRTRNSLRKHRKANQPNYVAGEGTLSEQDKMRIRDAEEQEIIFLQQVPAGTDISKVISAIPKVAIDQLAYDTRPMMDDVRETVGTQEATLGAAKPNVTATVGNIAEQSRVTMSSSNVDDLDDLLTCLAKAGGEIILREFSPDTVRRIAGPGFVFPAIQREDFLNELYLDHVASSSGRPNKALEVSNAQTLGPLMLQAGANPIGLIEEFARRLDDQIDIDKFFPLVPQPAQPGGLVSGAQPAQLGAPTPPQ